MEEDEPYDYQAGQELVGKIYTFEDGDSIEVIQIKRRDDGPWVTYHIIQSGGLPRKLLLPYNEFMEHYGHLFVINT